MSEGDRKGKVAVVFVHGQGEHVPLASAPELARTTWACDPDAPAEGSGKPRLRLTPDASISDEETPRATVSGKSGVEFFEFYWSDLMSGNQFAHVWRWFRNLIRKPADETPKRILPVRQLFIRIAEVGGIFIAAFALFTVSVRVLLNDPAGVSPAELFGGQCWSAGGASPPGWPEGVGVFENERFYSDPALRSDGLQAALGLTPPIAGAGADAATAADARSSYYESVCRGNDGGLFPISRLNEDERNYLPTQQRTLRLSCSVLDTSANDAARRLSACVSWRDSIPLFRDTTGHTVGVAAAAWSPDGSLVVTGGADNLAMIWNASAGGVVTTYGGHFSSVSFAAFSADGSAVATAGSFDNNVRVWDPYSGVDLAEPLPHDDSVTDLAASPDRFSQLIATASYDGLVRIWDWGRGTVRTLKGHEAAVTSVAWSPDGRRLVSASDDGTARIWNAETGATIAVLTHGASVYDAVFSGGDGLFVATASADATARVWDGNTGVPIGTPLQHPYSVMDAAFSRDGALLATAASDEFARVWDVRTGELRQQLLAVTTGAFGSAFVNGVAWSPTDDLVLGWLDTSAAEVWDATTGDSVGLPIMHLQSVTMAAFSPQGDRVLTASYDTSARITSLDGSQGLELGAATSGDDTYESATSWADGYFATLQREISSDSANGVVTSPFRYFQVWFAARLRTGAEFALVVIAPLLVGGIILFVMFADWTGLARRMAADSLRQTQARFERTRSWILLIVTLGAPWLLIPASAGLGRLYGLIPEWARLSLQVAVIVLISGVTLFAAGLLARKIIDGHALRALDALPPPRQSWRTQLRPWGVLLWIPAWAVAAIGVMIASSLGEPLMLIMPSIAIVIDLLVFSNRLKLFRRRTDLARWPFAWNLVNLAVFSIYAVFGGVATAFYSSAFSGALNTIGGLAAVAAGLGLIFYLVDARAGVIRHLILGLVATGLAAFAAAAAVTAADFAPIIGDYVGEGALPAALTLFGVVGVAFLLHLIRAIIMKARKSRTVRAFVIPSTIVAGFVVLISASVAYIGGQIDEARAVAAANQEIGQTLALRDVSTSADDSWTEPLEADLRRSRELGRLAVWSSYQVRRRQLEETDRAPELPPDREFLPDDVFAIRNADNFAIANDIEWSPTGALIAVGTSEGLVEIWDADRGRRIAARKIRDDSDYISGVYDVSFSGDGLLLAATNYDGDIAVWDLDSFSGTYLQRRHLFESPDMLGARIAFHPREWVLAASDGQGAVRLYDVNAYSSTAGMELASYQRHEAALEIFIEWSADGSILATGDSSGRVVVSQFDYFGAEILRQLGAFTASQNASLYDLAISPDGTLLATVDSFGQGQVWASGAAGSRLPGAPVATLQAQSFALNVVSFSPDGAWLASGNNDNSASLWDYATGLERRPLLGHQGAVRLLQWSPDGSQLVTHGDDNSIRVWQTDETPDPTLTPHAFGAQIAEFGREVSNYDIAYSPAPGSSLFAATGGDGRVRVWDLDCLAMPVSIAYIEYASCFHDIVFDPNGAVLEPTVVALPASPPAAAPDPAFADLGFADPVVAAEVASQPADAPAETAASEEELFSQFLVQLRTELSALSYIGPLEMGLLWAAFAVLVLIWSRMLVASLAVAIIAAPFALVASFGNLGQLDQLGQASLLRGESLVSLVDSPLRLINAIYAFFLAFCLAWLVTQILRELLNLSSVRGLSLAALGLSAAFGLLAYVTVQPVDGLNWAIGSIQLTWTVSVIIVVMVVLGGLFAAAHYFLVPIMADSARYLSPKPHNIARRREIVDRGVRLLKALSASGRFDRIIVVAHSLGTLVAFDTVSRFWTHFEQAAGRPDLRPDRAALASSSAALSEGVSDALSSAAEHLSEARRPVRAGKRKNGADAPRPPEGALLRSDEQRMDRLCEILGDLAWSYRKAGKPRRPKKKDDAETAERKARGAAARAEAAESFRGAVRDLRAGPSCFCDAQEKLRAAAGHVRAAYGIDPGAPPRFSLFKSKRELGEAEAIATALEYAAGRLAGVTELHARHLERQQAFARALAEGPEGERWLVTDLVTLGSPLSHGEYLLGADHRVRTLQSEAAKVVTATDALKEHLSTETQGVDHEDDELDAAFPASRWTNLYFRGDGVLGGDIVGGPVWSVFGPGVIDMALDGKPNNSSFAHNEYWKCDMDDEAMRDGSAPDHIKALRRAMRLPRKA